MLPDSTKIQIAENEEDNLMLQSAAGYYFDLAEYLNYACWMLCIISALISFGSDKLVFTIFMIFTDILAAICGWFVIHYTENAANLRRQFDQRVVFANEKDKSLDERNRLKEIALCYCDRHKRKYSRDSMNNGGDILPGKKDWYEFAEQIKAPYAQIECLDQNKWWDKKLQTIRWVIMLLFCIFLVIAIVVFIWFFRGALPLPAFINAIAVVAARCVERFVQYIRYWEATIKASTALEIVKENPTAKSVKMCFSYFDEYRHIPVLEISIIHRCLAGKMTRLYRNIKSYD